MNYILILLLCTSNVFANTKSTLNNTISFFTKESLAQPLPSNPCAKIKIQVPIPNSAPANTVTQVYAQNFSCQEINIKLSVFFHSQNGSEYLSQQVSVYKGTQLLSLCSGYFPLSQNFLVPGACAGVFGQKLFGFSIIK